MESQFENENGTLKVITPLDPQVETYTMQHILDSLNRAENAASSIAEEISKWTALKIKAEELEIE